MENYNNNGLFLPWNIELQRITENVDLLGEFPAKADIANTIDNLYEDRDDIKEITEWYNEIFSLALECVENKSLQEQAQDPDRHLQDKYGGY